ncbi:MAG: hypothetical protein P8017_11620, partial [Deltaproteobacteria bacterium]
MSFLFLVIAVGTAYLISHKIFSLKFRATNDALHKQQVPITLDFLIPGGTYVDEKMTIGEVVKVHLQKPRRKLDDFILKLSEIIAPK